MDSFQSLKTADMLFKQGIEAHYDKKDSEKVLECFREALILDPNYFQASAEQGNVLRFIGKYEETLIELDKSIAIQESAAAYFIKARVLIELNRQEEAELCFNLGKSMVADDVFTFLHKGHALYDLERNEEAIVCFDKVIQLQPDCIPAYHNKALALSDLGQKEVAITCYDKEIQQ